MFEETQKKQNRIFLIIFAKWERGPKREEERFEIRIKNSASEIRALRVIFPPYYINLFKYAMYCTHISPYIVPGYVPKQELVSV